MRALIFGGTGNIGSAVAWDLVKHDSVESVGLIGRREEALRKTKDWINSEKIVLHPQDILNQKETVKIMQQYDVGVIALPDRKTSYRVFEAAIEARLSIVDMLEEYHRRPDKYELEGLEIPQNMSIDDYGEWLHVKAMDNGITILDGIGFAPGLSNITLGEAIRKMDRTDSAIARVGGIPSKEAAQNHPLKYISTWAFWHVLREYMVKLNIIKNGEVVEVDATTDRERFVFNKFGKNEELECAVTPGMPSFIYTRPQLKEFAEKTIRWSGHWDGVDTLKECGLLDLEPIQFEGKKIAPRDFLLALIQPRLKPREGETDVCVMWNTAIGYKDGKEKRIDYYMWDEADRENQISSMARVTGFPSSIAAMMIGSGEIEEKGIVPPEDCIKEKLYIKFMDELKKRNIIILEEETFGEHI